MRKFYYRTMAKLCADIAWFWFFIEPTNRSSGQWFEASKRYERQLAKAEHPARG